jgi:hypothetical protein
MWMEYFYVKFFFLHKLEFLVHKEKGGGGAVSLTYIGPHEEFHPQFSILPYMHTH